MEDISVYKQLFLNASEGMVLSNNKGIILEVNPGCCNMFGYNHSELIGNKIEILIPEEFRKRHVHHRDHFNTNPENRSMGLGINLAGRKKDGSTFPVEISLNHYGIGEDLRVMALISDITKRAKIEQHISELNDQLELKVTERTQELLRSQYLYVAIARNFPDGTISIFDKNLKYIFFEGKELYKAGIKSENLLGTSIEKRLPEDVKEEVLEHLRKVFEGSGGIIEFKTKGFVFEINAVPLFDSEKEINQILVVERNITAQKKAETEMQGRLDQERALNELKSRFVSMASHEFRTPLSTILSSISLISKYNEGVNSNKILKHIGRIKSSVQNLTGILNDFLSLDKLEAGKIRVNPVSLNISELIEDILEELESMLKENQKIETSYDLKTDIITQDPHILKNILINLTSNAIKYSEGGSVINLSVVVKNDLLTLTINDRGIGIPEEEQNQLFERFFRAKNVTNIGGTGLGLNIVKKYIDLLNGDIKFESKSGEGTTFIVTLPLD